MSAKTLIKSTKKKEYVVESTPDNAQEQTLKPKDLNGAILTNDEIKALFLKILASVDQVDQNEREEHS
jgi:hypothetical protein